MIEDASPSTRGRGRARWRSLGRISYIISSTEKWRERHTHTEKDRETERERERETENLHSFQEGGTRERGREKREKEKYF